MTSLDGWIIDSWRNGKVFLVHPTDPRWICVSDEDIDYITKV